MTVPDDNELDELWALTRARIAAMAGPDARLRAEVDARFDMFTRDEARAVMRETWLAVRRQIELRRQSGA